MTTDSNLRDIASSREDDPKQPADICRRIGLFSILAQPRHIAALSLCLTFLTALLWARARDPFRRISFSVRSPSGQQTEAMAVLPNREGQFPVIIFLHGSGGSVLANGNSVRLIAEIGCAAVTFDYDQSNQDRFDEQLKSVVAFVLRQSWAKKDSLGWIANSLGAQRSLRFFVSHPESRPKVMVRLAGGWISELDDLTNAPSPVLKARFPGNLQVWLLHGESDDVFPSTDVEHLASFLQNAGAEVRLTILPGTAHNFGDNSQLIVRRSAEFCAESFGNTRPIAVNERPTLWYYWLPVAILGLFLIFIRILPGAIHSFRDGSRKLLAVAVAMSLFAGTETMIHLVLPKLQLSESTLSLARRWLVAPQMLDDFNWLAQKPILKHEQLGVALEHVELASYNRKLVNWSVDDQFYRDFVLSPVIGAGPKEVLNWRRPLWEAFYPRIRHESDPVAVAQTVIRFLCERVSVNKSIGSRGIAEDWAAGVTDHAGFERLYAAALRSVGVAARFDDHNRTEIYCVDKWRPAPRSILDL
jgi:acetyl esterase/lipase